MEWPVGRLADDKFAGRSVLKLLCGAIDSGLGIALARCETLQQAAELIDHHFAKSDVAPVAVFACLPGRDRTTAAALGHVVQCLDLCGNAGGQMAKLAIYCIDELPGVSAYWSKHVPETKRVGTLPLKPLRPMDDRDLRQWHVRYNLEPRWPWPECLRLFDRTLEELGLKRRQLRLHQWAEAVKHHRPDLAELIPEPPKAAR